MNYNISESFHQGQCLNAYELFGAHLKTYNGVKGVEFVVWAPHATGISLIGNWNGWDPTVNPMHRTDDPNIWTCFVAHAKEYDSYKYRIYLKDGNSVDKTDPYAFYCEPLPGTASVIYDYSKYKWTDKEWMKARTKNYDKPVNIYEVFAGAWQKEAGKPNDYIKLADKLIPYLKENAFTHIEFMPLTEYPYDGSWGYQANGYFAATSRYGVPEQFQQLVDKLHEAGIGVIMDMVPVHFVKDSHGLRYFDGEPLYEYTNPNDAESEWGTMNFDLGKEEVRSFLMSSANFWASVYHIDGIRTDAVANLIFWGGNKDRGANEGALAFMRRLNYHISEKNKGIMLIAEDSSDFPNVTKSTLDGGLGFDYKWDMGWMNDTLKYYKMDPIYRKWHHNTINWSMAYFYSERFLLPFSHDEVVHGKATIIDKMWGLYDDKFRQVRNLYLYMFAHPGKKLNFMGNEIAMFREFDEAKDLDWFMLDYPAHDSFQRYFRDLGRIYQNHPCLYKDDYNFEGFKWIDADNAEQSIFTFYRADEEEAIITLLNMTPNSYESYEIGVPFKGTYSELINSERDIYTGCNMCNFKAIRSKACEKGTTLHGFENKINICVAPFAGIMLKVKVPKPKKVTVEKGEKECLKTKKNLKETSN